MWFLVGLALWLLAGCTSEKERAKELCDCVTTETGEWDMYLSPECERLCKDMFGPELDGMEEWFQRNCERTHHPRTEQDNKIVL